MINLGFNKLSLTKGAYSMMWFLAIIAIIAVVVLLKLKGGSDQSAKNNKRSRNTSQRKKTKTSIASKTEDNKYHAVSVSAGDGACEKAKEIEDKKFLVKEAPDIPLEQCGDPECACRYQHHDDRRSHEDRRLRFGVSQDLHSYNEGERREKRDRRKPKFND